MKSETHERMWRHSLTLWPLGCMFHLVTKVGTALSLLVPPPRHTREHEHSSGFGSGVSSLGVARYKLVVARVL